MSLKTHRFSLVAIYLHIQHINYSEINGFNIGMLLVPLVVVVVILYLLYAYINENIFIRYFPLIFSTYLYYFQATSIDPFIRVCIIC